jgi:hypothetical protein
MYTPAELLIDIAPEFASIDTSGAITVAEMQIAPDLCGDKRPMLVAYLAAHILTRGRRAGGATGSIASITEGDVTVTYVNKKGFIETTGLSNTGFGEEFDRLRRGCLVAMRTRVNCVCRSSIYGQL